LQSQQIARLGVDQSTGYERHSWGSPYKEYN
jgi:hypothetical protein